MCSAGGIHKLKCFPKYLRMREEPGQVQSRHPREILSKWGGSHWDCCSAAGRAFDSLRWKGMRTGRDQAILTSDTSETSPGKSLLRRTCCTQVWTTFDIHRPEEMDWGDHVGSNNLMSPPKEFPIIFDPNMLMAAWRTLSHNHFSLLISCT